MIKAYYEKMKLIQDDNLIKLQDILDNLEMLFNGYNYKR